MKKKKMFLIVLLVIFFSPFVVKAESNYLYDVLKDEAESGGLALEYTKEHHDSFIEEPSKKIYYWHSETYEEGDAIKNKWNVIFANYCWQIVRTTDTGGVKLLYSGIPNEGKCDNTRDNQHIATSPFNNSGKSPAYVGYMYDPDTVLITTNYSTPQSGSLFGAGVIYSEGNYTLTNTSTTLDANHHYTCNNTTGTCSVVRYYYYANSHVELSNGKVIEQAVEDMIYSNDVNKTDSVVKSVIDSWYQDNMTTYTNKLEDTIYCNDRSIQGLGGWKPNGGNLRGGLYFGINYLNPNLVCVNETDKFSLTNTKAQLTYPVGLLTFQETGLFGQRLTDTVDRYWIMTPYGYDDYFYGAMMKTSSNIGYGYGNVDYSTYVRPAISLKPNSVYVSGDGSTDNPYIINDKYKINIEIKNETEDLSIEIDNISQVPEGREVKFKVTPIKGHRVTSIRIIDENNNEIEYIKTDNKDEYIFTMPSSDVTIIPSYEKVSNAVRAESVKGTKAIFIEVEDVSAVVYDDLVRFTVQPEDGYEVESIDIIDKEKNKIDYKKTDNKNEYEFIMPDTDVTITPTYRIIELEKDNDTSKNPNTADRLYIIVLLMIISISIGILSYKKKVSRYKV